MLDSLVLILIACATSLVLTPLVREAGLRLGAVDHPGGRKIHRNPVPRIGGISVFVSLVVTLCAAEISDWIWGRPLLHVELPPAVVNGVLLVFVMGLYDDLTPVRAWAKLTGQCAAAGVVLWSGLRIDLFAPSDPSLWIVDAALTFLWIVGLTNAFNLIDGLDGLAAGVGMIAATASAAILILAGADLSDASLLLILAGSLVGFLRYNFHPASIFLGDSGSQIIGYLLAILSIAGSQKAATSLPLLIPLLIFGLPIADTTLSMVRRVLKSQTPRQGDSIATAWLHAARQMFQADRDHVHHRLLAIGLTHRQSVLTLYALTSALGLLAVVTVVANYRNAGAILLTVVIGTYVGIRKLGYEEMALGKKVKLPRWDERTVLTRLSSLAVMDIAAVFLAYWTAFALKYDGIWTLEGTRWFLLVFPLVVLCQCIVFLVFGFSRDLWRATSLVHLWPLAAAVTAAVLLSYAVSVIYAPPPGITSFFGINWILLEVFIVGGRSLNMVVAYLRRRGPFAKDVRVLIYGAGRRGESILWELWENRRLDLCPVGFIDDDPSLARLKINGVPVVGTGRDVGDIIQREKISAVVVSTSRIPAERLEPLTRLCGEHRIALLRGEFTLERLPSAGASFSRERAERRERLAERQVA